MKDCTVVIPFAYNPVWLQTCIASFKQFTDLKNVDILVVDNHEQISRQGKDIRVLTETALGEGIKILPQRTMIDENRAYASHAAALNYALHKIDTPYMFCTESDVTAARPDWLDWYFAFQPSPMIGWFWPARQYINPSWTLLDVAVLKKIDAEIKANKDTNFKWALDHNRATKHLEEHWTNLIQRGFVGPFNEMRGFARNPATGDIERGLCRDDHDTGSWLYFRMQDEYECRRVPGQEIALGDWQKNKTAPTKYQYVGESEEGAYLYHHSAGTVSHDYEKHMITVEWQSYCIEWWLRREYRLWEEIVPESIRKETLSKGLVPTLEHELDRAMKSIHIIRIGDKVRAYHGEVEPYIRGLQPEPNVPGDGLNATVVGHEPFEDLWITEFEEKPGVFMSDPERRPEGDKYYKLREEGGKWFANCHPKWLVKR